MGDMQIQTSQAIQNLNNTITKHNLKLVLKFVGNNGNVHSPYKVQLNYRYEIYYCLKKVKRI